MNLYFGMLIIFVLLIISGFIMEKAPQNYLFGIRTSATLADSDVWRITNKKASYFSFIIGCIFVVLDLLFWLLGYPEDTYGVYLLILFTIVIVLFSIYLVLYSNTLFEKKNNGLKTIPEVTLPKYFIHIVAISAFIIGVCGILMIFVNPNSFIGVRTYKTLTDPILWKKVNVISGIGFAFIGLLFTLVFLNISRKENSERTKSFKRNIILFAITVLIWSALSVGLTYLI